MPTLAGGTPTSPQRNPQPVENLPICESCGFGPGARTGGMRPYNWEGRAVILCDDCHGRASGVWATPLSWDQYAMDIRCGWVMVGGYLCGELIGHPGPHTHMIRQDDDGAEVRA